MMVMGMPSTTLYLVTPAMGLQQPDLRRKASPWSWSRKDCSEIWFSGSRSVIGKKSCAASYGEVVVSLSPS